MYLYGLKSITLSIAGECMRKNARKRDSYIDISIGSLNVFTDYYRCIQQFIQQTKCIEVIEE